MTLKLTSKEKEITQLDPELMEGARSFLNLRYGQKGNICPMEERNIIKVMNILSHYKVGRKM